MPQKKTHSFHMRKGPCQQERPGSSSQATSSLHVKVLIENCYLLFYFVLGSKVYRNKTPQQAGVKMQQLMSSRGGYNLFSNNCHLAQEGTRRWLGLSVRDPYHNPFRNPTQFCQCVRRGVPVHLLLAMRANPYIKLIIAMCQLTG